MHEAIFPFVLKTKQNCLSEISSNSKFKLIEKNDDNILVEYGVDLIKLDFENNICYNIEFITANFASFALTQVLFKQELENNNMYNEHMDHDFSDIIGWYNVFNALFSISNNYKTPYEISIVLYEMKIGDDKLYCTHYHFIDISHL